MKKYDLKFYLFAFFSASILGWLGELVYHFVLVGNIINPGVLKGPWCSIYGLAELLILFLTSRKNNMFINFFSVFFIAVFDEYVISFISEVVFNNRIWDYSNQLFNIHGRVCLAMSLLFTIFGLLAIYSFNPILEKIYTKHDRTVKYFVIINSILFISNIILQIVF